MNAATRELMMRIFSDKIAEIQGQIAIEQDPEKYRALLHSWAVVIELESKFYLETVRSIA